MTRLMEKYKTQVIPSLQKALDRKNVLSIPRLEKVVVSMGVGSALLDRKRMDAAVADLTKLSGQKPVVCNAKKSVSNFKLRQGVPIGCKVTLRGRRMYEFLDRLITIAIPRIRDFRGLDPNGFDGHGNYSLGLSEQTVFPEVDIDQVEFVQGMNVTVVTNAKDDAEGRKLLTELGMPFRSQN